MEIPTARTLPDLLDALAARHPGREALVGGDQRYTYAQMRAAVRATAKGLHALGVRRGDKVAILMGNRCEWVIADFAITLLGGVMVGLNRMDAILDIDLPNRCATVQPGLINLWLTNAVRDRGWFFAPDPSSQMVSSIGGNCSTNAGGPHCLKYGITVNHVLGLQVVTGAGELLWLGGKTHDRPGYDLTGVVVGGEGTLALVTAAAVRLLPVPEGVKTLLASFAALDDR